VEAEKHDAEKLRELIARLNLKKLPKLRTFMDAMDFGMKMVALTNEIAVAGRNQLPVLFEALKSKSSNVRRGVAGAMGRIDDPAVVPPLIRLLKDSDVHVRAAAAMSLGERKDPRAIDNLLTTAKEDVPYVSTEAMRALGEMGDLRAKPVLLHGTRSKWSIVREAALEALGKIDALEAMPALIDRLVDKHAYARQSAAKSLGLLGRREATPFLLPLLGDPEWFVRYEAMEALGRIGDTRALLPAIEVLEKDGDANVRSSAARTLGRFKGRCAIDPLLSALKDKDVRVPPYAAEALGRIGDPSTAPKITEAMKRPIGDLREKCATALIGMKTPDLVPRIEAMLRSEKDIELALLSALILFKWSRHEEAFRKALKVSESDSKWNRCKAVDMLGRMGDPRAIPYLMAVLEKEVAAQDRKEEFSFLHVPIALEEITGLDFDFDIERCRKWYAEEWGTKSVPWKDRRDRDE